MEVHAVTFAAKTGLLIGAIAIAVVAFIALRPENDDDSTPASRTTQNQAAREAPESTRIQIRGAEVIGGAPDIEVEKGTQVRIVVSADAPDELHLHGYDITREAAPGRPARFSFSADLEGAFEMESHTAEDAGKDPIVARLALGPS